MIAVSFATWIRWNTRMHFCTTLVFVDQLRESRESIYLVTPVFRDLFKRFSIRQIPNVASQRTWSWSRSIDETMAAMPWKTMKWIGRLHTVCGKVMQVRLDVLHKMNHVGKIRWLTKCANGFIVTGGFVEVWQWRRFELCGWKTDLLDIVIMIRWDVAQKRGSRRVAFLERIAKRCSNTARCIGGNVANAVGDGSEFWVLQRLSRELASFAQLWSRVEAVCRAAAIFIRQWRRWDIVASSEIHWWRWNKREHCGHDAVGVSAVRVVVIVMSDCSFYLMKRPGCRAS